MTHKKGADNFEICPRRATLDVEAAATLTESSADTYQRSEELERAMAMTAATGFSSGADFDPRAEPSRGGGAYGDAELTVREEAYCALCEEDGAKRPPCCAYALCAACAAAHALVRAQRRREMPGLQRRRALAGIRAR